MWLDLLPEPLEPRAALPGPLDVDVAIVGGGFTGLWTAYYLAKADPSLRIAVLEREVAGFGASGRNGGWVSPFFPAPLERIEAAHGRDAAVAMQRAMFDTVDVIGRDCAAEGIDARYTKGGVLVLATGPEQIERVRAETDYYRSWGLGDEEITWLDAGGVRERLAIEGCLGATYLTHCACLDPARVVRGLAHVVERLGVTIYEKTPVLSLGPGEVVTARGTVRARIVVRATEGFTPELPGARREIDPGVFTDDRHRAAAGDASGTRSAGRAGRRSPTAATSTSTRCAPRTTVSLWAGAEPPTTSTPRCATNTSGSRRCTRPSKRTLKKLFPAARDAKITHRWGGSLGIPRDWFPAVGYDQARGYAWAGGYVGDGVAASNLAGRTLADLITGRESDLTRLPWVNHRSPKWEIEPLRWVGVRTSLAVFGSADRTEQKSGKPALRARLMRRILPI